MTHTTDVGKAVSTREQATPRTRPLELDYHDLLVAFDSGNRPVHQKSDTDSQQKVLAEANVRPYLH